MARFMIGVFFFFISSTLFFPQDRTVTAAAGQWVPYVDEQDATGGLSLAILRAALSTQGYTVQMEYIPWARAELGVISGKYDILPDTWYSEERNGFMYFSDPYFTNTVKFIKRRGDRFEYEGLESLRGKNVGVIKRFIYDEEFQASSFFSKDSSSDLITNIRKLLVNRIDLTLDDELVAREVILRADPDLLEKIEFTENALSVKPLYVAAGRDNPKGLELITAFNTGLALIRENGTYWSILDRYGIEP